MNEQQRKKALDSWKGKRNNAQGHFFEGFIKTACAVYKQKGIAYVEKMPEPFMVLEKKDRGIFKGRFIAHAQPDFMGTLSGGRSICFEAKYTSTDKLAQTVLTAEQWDSLEQHWKAGAKAGVCAGIGNVYAFIPWPVWRSMQKIYGRKFMTAEELEPYRVKFNGACMFLDPLHPDAAADKEARDGKREEMTIEQAIAILEPETTSAAIYEYEYYGGFRGEEAKIKACEQACRIAAAVMREEAARRQAEGAWGG